ncbi:hypothetical protein F5B22DRAFT_599503 [Xylaria bambusicola]|uniref:uncharacterized protein n=1 Tax=Xylaria bambusicola TaxID=326684 RepID=UPI0020078076|nr:uncharacterized protein F5B22DRAFT_599503 [Xylaria bambusicola]KAI0518513.1 hypothetical protein F5B22DRAFT_599503 [Xylaria bambusicola]
MPLDKHGVPQIHDPRFVLFTKIEFLSIIFSPLSLGPTKLSIVCFYRRIFRGSKFSILTSILLAVIASWAAAFFFAGLLICVPVEAFWTQDPAARCFVPIPLFYTGAISDTIVDVIILSIPVPLVWKLNLPTKQKISVSLIFLLGAFIIGISAARIALFVHAGTSLKEATDISYDTSPTLYWSQLECSVAVICACLPTLRIVLNDVSVKSLRNFASKFSLRGISTKAPSQQSIQQWSDSLTKPDSLSAALRSSGYMAAVQSEPSSHISEGITANKNVHQCSEAC